MSKVTGALKTAGVKTAPVVGQATQVAGATTAAAGAVAYEGARRAFNAIRDPGFILFIVGLLTFVFNEYLANATIAVLFGAIFMIYSAFFIFKGKGLIITVIFLIWYIFIGIKSIEQVKYYILPILLTGMVAHGIYKKLSKEGGFGEGFGGELSGLIPIAIFFLDVGLVEWLAREFSFTLTPLIQTILIFTPWWALLGLFTTKKENIFITIAKFAGIVYIFSLLTFGIAPEAYSASQSILPGPEEFAQAKQEFQEQLPQTENPIYSNIVCIFIEPTNVPACVSKRQEESEIKSICEKIRELEPGTTAYDDCFKEEREKKKEAAMQIAGTEDPTIKEPTQAEFKVSDYFPKTTYQPRYPYPIQLEIKNPREQTLNINLKCFFKKGKENIAGMVEPNRFVITKTDEVKSIICTPNQDLNGTYTLVYQADIYNLSTFSRLTRLFVGDASEKTKEEIDELKSTFIPGKKYLSQAPKEFARINFGFGEPETNPVIEYDDRPLLISTIENVGRGKILSIKNYHIDLEKEGIVPIDRWDCFSVTAEKLQTLNTFLPKTKTVFKQIIPLTTCFIDIPEDLMNPPDFFFKEFTATLSYDYQIEKEIRTEVKILELTS
jgi:hypothetical protein